MISEPESTIEDSGRAGRTDVLGHFAADASAVVPTHRKMRLAVATSRLLDLCGSRRLVPAPVGALVVCAAIIALAIKRHRPFFGLMDDATLIQWVPSIRNSNLLQFTMEWVQADIAWGMVRPFYPAFTLLTYGLAGRNPTLLFMINLVVVALTLVAFALAVSRLVRFKGSGLYGRTAFVATAVLAALCIGFTHALLLHPSLQEKLVLLAAAASFVFVTARSVARLGPGLWYPAAALVIMIGMLTKAQYVTFVPALALVVLVTPTRSTSFLNAPILRACWILAVGGASGVVLLLLARSGTYTSRYGQSGGALLDQVATENNLALVGLAFLSLVTLGLLVRLRRLAANQALLAAAAPLSLITYVVIMVPWGLGGYLLAFAGVLIGWTFAVTAVAAGRAGAAAGLVVVMVLGPIATHRGSDWAFARLGELRTILESPQMAALEGTNDALYMPCMEGADAVQFYLRSLVDVDVKVTFDQAGPDGRPAASSAKGPVWWIGDHALCWLDLPTGTTVAGGNHSDSFRLVRVD